jgi:predicted hotdog family 3-hydroxylacyl-ACP dehydratase
MIQDLLPHRAPMLLIDAVTAVDAQGGLGRVRLDPAAWYADGDGATPAWIGVEFMAQTIAACRGQWQRAAGGPARGGYLVAIRNFRSTVAAFPAGAELEIRVRLLDADPSGLCAFECAILHLGRALAQATLKVMER